LATTGLTAAVLHEIDVNLLAHELIKVRVFSEDRSEREAMLERICAALDAASVQHIGRLLAVAPRAGRRGSAATRYACDRQGSACQFRNRRKDKDDGEIRTTGKATAQSAGAHDRAFSDASRALQQDATAERAGAASPARRLDRRAAGRTN
jgi:RNA-binding protein YhbY